MKHSAIIIIGIVAIHKFILLMSGCAYVGNIDDVIDTIKPPPEQPSEPTPGPVDPMSIAESGEYSPDPVQVLYTFNFQDGTKVRFREDHRGDYWGKFPSAGWGQIEWPDGRKEGFDANRTIRHGGLRIAKTPVTTLSHGKRMFWMADAEGQKDVKKVTIFEDGWNPLVEGALLATQESIGITSPLVRTDVVVEARK